MSLYADYIKERLGHEMVENAFGFISYSMSGQDCKIWDIYVKPEVRQKSVGKDLANIVTQRARENGCKYLWGRIYPNTGGSDVSLKAHLAYGFKVVEATEGHLILKKEI